MQNVASLLRKILAGKFPVDGAVNVDYILSSATAALIGRETARVWQTVPLAQAQSLRRSDLSVLQGRGLDALVGIDRGSQIGLSNSGRVLRDFHGTGQVLLYPLPPSRPLSTKEDDRGAAPEALRTHVQHLRVPRDE